MKAGKIELLKPLVGLRSTINAALVMRPPFCNWQIMESRKSETSVRRSLVRRSLVKGSAHESDSKE